ncbi:hypothetical protein MVEG_03213 [Podila verticillata NRRL 6337]|nr:hypothetical protein MVEG_03213 [Podila verticillata NRRL 6337]
MSDLCAFCSSQLNSLHIFSLYCSEQCREADALKCCSFHGCLHPDDSTKHDHLRFCHHHRHPSTTTSLALTSSLSMNNLLRLDIHQEKDEWMDFLQSQYNASHQHDSHRRLSDSIFSNASVPGSREVPSPRGRPLSTLRQSPSVPRKMTLACHHTETTPHHCPVRSIREKLAAQPLPSSTKNDPVANSAPLQEQLTAISKVQETPIQVSDPSSSPSSSTQPAATAGTTAIDTTPLSLSSSPLLLLPSKTPKPHDTPFSPHTHEMDHTWPEMDKYFFCFHDDLRSSSESSSDSESEDSITSRSRSRSSSLSSLSSSISSSPRRFVSELPPPSFFSSLSSRRSTLSSEDSFEDTGDFLPLSASIWGPGWQQVEPLPASFVQALQRQQQLDKAAAEKEAQAAATATQSQLPSKSKKKKAKKAAALAAALATKVNSNDSESVDGSEEDSMSNGDVPKTCNSLCSARLPRSLQFVDEQPE